MLTEIEIADGIRKIVTAISNMHNFPLSKVIEFVNACDVANRRIPITSDIQKIIDRSVVPFAAINASVLSLDADKLSGSSQVVIYNEMRSGFILRLEDIKDAVQQIMGRDKATFVLLQLDKISDYYHFSQGNLLAVMKAMEVNAAKTPLLVAVVLPMITALKDDVENPSKAKQKQFVIINSDRLKMSPVITALKSCLKANLGSYLIIYCDDDERILENFPISVLYSNVHAPEYLSKNQDLIEKPIVNIVHLSKLKITNSSWVKVENFGSKPIRLWRSIKVSTVCPEDAPTINANTNDTIYVGNMGVDDAFCLMAEFTDPLDMVKVKFSVRKKK